MDIKKTVILGTFGPEQSHRNSRYYSPLHVKVEIRFGRDELNPEVKPRLSICGETYRPGTQDIESGGQILEDVRLLLDDPKADLNRPREQIARLLEVWERWHLNDMRAGCEHQRASWNPSAAVTLVTYTVRDDVRQARRELEKAKLADLTTLGSATLSASEQVLMSLELYKDIVRDADEPPPDPAIYVERTKDILNRPSREIKYASWVRPEESPKGLLGKSCEVCGYKYGSAWLYEEIPADVIEFLKNF